MKELDEAHFSSGKNTAQNPCHGQIYNCSALGEAMITWCSNVDPIAALLLDLHDIIQAWEGACSSNCSNLDPEAAWLLDLHHIIPHDKELVQATWINMTRISFYWRQIFSMICLLNTTWVPSMAYSMTHPIARKVTLTFRVKKLRNVNIVGNICTLAITRFKCLLLLFIVSRLIPLVPIPIPMPLKHMRNNMYLASPLT